ncbi:MAG: hypothetical protein ACKVS9_07105 [Phycisphaerae bacterium]
MNTGIRFAAVPAFLLAAATLAIAQTTTLEENTTVPTTGADIATFQRGVTHFTYDLRGNTGAADWTGSEISVDVADAFRGRVWHASDQRILYRDHTREDPNDPLTYVHNLLTPGLVNTPENQLNARMYNTFLTRPGPRFTTDVSIAPGTVVSNDTRIRGLASQGIEIPLAWFDTEFAPLNNTVLGRFTFEINPLTFPQPGTLVINASPQSAPILFATIRGRTTSVGNPSGNSFSFDIRWQPVPEPTTITLLSGAAIIFRRRVCTT